MRGTPRGIDEQVSKEEVTVRVVASQISGQEFERR
jgi:hypothetical protein